MISNKKLFSALAASAVLVSAVGGVGVGSANAESNIDNDVKTGSFEVAKTGVSSVHVINSVDIVGSGVNTAESLSKELIITFDDNGADSELIKSAERKETVNVSVVNETNKVVLEDVNNKVKEKVKTDSTVSNEVKNEVKDVVKDVVKDEVKDVVKDEVKEDKEDNKVNVTSTWVDTNTNDDVKRRDALGNILGITLTDKDVWKDKKGEFTVDADGVKHAYTSHDELKALGSYITNANRQDLIQYGIRTSDWQPYRAFEATKSPLYYELVNGKYEHTKIYYGNQLEYTVASFNRDIANLYSVISNSTERDIKIKEIEDNKSKIVGEIVKDFNSAPGIVPYIVNVNSNESVAKQYGLAQPDNSFFDSKYNDPSVLANGTFTVK